LAPNLAHPRPRVAGGKGGEVRTFIWTIFSIEVLVVIVKAAYLGFGTYPKKPETRGVDAIGLLVAIVTAAWALMVLR